MVCGWQKRPDSGDCKTSTLLPDFALWRPTVESSVIQRRTLSSCFDAQKKHIAEPATRRIARGPTPDKIRVIQRRACRLRDKERLRFKVLTCMWPAL
jgi:hypothetical protein